MKPALLELLACPHDDEPLRLADGDGQSAADVEAGSLECERGHAFEISSGVPRLVPSEDPGEAETQVGTAESFGAKWAKLRDEVHEATIRFQHEWYDERYGWGDEAGLEAFLEGQGAILDAGCGLGRDVARYARLSDAQVVGFDLSGSVERANLEFGTAPNAHFLQGDIMAPPFRPESFDFVVSDQVIHHTPDCPAAFRALAALVKPGGQIAIYVYRKKSLMRELADEHVRELTTRMSVDECMEFSEQITELGRELSRLGAKVNLERGVPLLGIEPGEHDVQRLIYWNFLKCFWNEDIGEEGSVLGNFDWYHPPYASRHTPEEVSGWCDDLGLDVVHLDVILSGISVRAKRPA